MASVHDGWAVGGSWIDWNYVPVVLHWNGTVWETVTMPEGHPGYRGPGYYFDIAVLAPNDVYALGLFGLAHWDGSAWSWVELPSVGNGAGIDMYHTDEGWVTGWAGDIAHWDGQSWEVVFDRTHAILEVDTVAPHEAWAVCSESTGGAILHYVAPSPVQGALAPGESLVHTYAGHETRITLGTATMLNASDTFTISYKLRPNDQGELKGIDHFFEIATDAAGPTAPLTVTVRFSDTQEYDLFPGTINLYQLGSNGWETDGIAIVSAQENELEAMVTELGSFGVLGLEERQLYLPVVLRDR